MNYESFMNAYNAGTARLAVNRKLGCEVLRNEVSPQPIFLLLVANGIIVALVTSWFGHWFVAILGLLSARLFWGVRKHGMEEEIRAYAMAREENYESLQTAGIVIVVQRQD